MTMADEPRTAIRPAVGFRRRALFALAASLVGAACTVGQRPEPPALPAPLVEQVPLTVGVHYTLGFRMARPISADRLWKIGDASVALFDSALRSVFAEVVPVDPWPSGSRRPAVAGIIVPEVLGFSADQNQVTIRYGVEVFSAQGERITGWEAVGRWTTAPGTPGRLFMDPANLRDAMRAAGAALIASFYDNPHARSWLEATGVSAGESK